MQVSYYTKFSDYLIKEKKTNELRLAAIDELIEMTILKQSDAITNNDPSISEYQFEDGQVKIRTAYRSSTDFKSALISLESIRQIYLNRLNGRVMSLVDINVVNR